MKPLLCCLLFCLPLKQLKITSGFGMRAHPITGKWKKHQAVDLRASADTAFAMFCGRVTTTGYHQKLGLWVRIRHEALITEYGHLRQVFVLPGDSVAAGTPVAITGATGMVTAEHLHLAIYFNDKAIDPARFLYELIKKYHE